jgi:hypothetical protein
MPNHIHLIAVPRAEESLRLPIGVGMSARAHLSGCDDHLVKVAPLLAIVADWKALLDSALPEEQLKEPRGHSRTGRPLQIFLPHPPEGNFAAEFRRLAPCEMFCVILA